MLIRSDSGLRAFKNVPEAHDVTFALNSQVDGYLAQGLPAFPPFTYGPENHTQGPKTVVFGIFDRAPHGFPEPEGRTRCLRCDTPVMDLLQASEASLRLSA